MRAGHANARQCRLVEDGWTVRCLLELWDQSNDAHRWVRCRTVIDFLRRADLVHNSLECRGQCLLAEMIGHHFWLAEQPCLELMECEKWDEPWLAYVFSEGRLHSPCLLARRYPWHFECLAARWKFVRQPIEIQQCGDASICVT